MKPTDFLSGIVYFFNDLIGSVVPGLVLIAGLVSVNVVDKSLITEIIEFDVSLKWLTFIIISYVLGHASLSLHRILQKYIGAFFRGLNNLIKKWKWDTKTYQELTTVTSSYLQFKEIVQHEINKKKGDSVEIQFEYNNLRNIAMTISSEAGELARRFMFISLFCYGIAMAILITGIFDLYNNFESLKFAIYIFVFLLFYMRGIDFEFRAQNTPFPVALAELITEKVTKTDEE